MWGVSQVPVALMIPRAENPIRSVSIRKRPSRSQTAWTVTGR
jgi:hypothetical protein